MSAETVAWIAGAGATLILLVPWCIEVFILKGKEP